MESITETEWKINIDYEYNNYEFVYSKFKNYKQILPISIDIDSKKSITQSFIQYLTNLKDKCNYINVYDYDHDITYLPGTITFLKIFNFEGNSKFMHYLPPQLIILWLGSPHDSYNLDKLAPGILEVNLQIDIRNNIDNLPPYLQCLEMYGISIDSLENIPNSIIYIYCEELAPNLCDRYNEENQEYLDIFPKFKENIQFNSNIRIILIEDELIVENEMLWESQKGLYHIIDNMQDHMHNKSYHK